MHTNHSLANSGYTCTVYCRSATGLPTARPFASRAMAYSKCTKQRIVFHQSQGLKNQARYRESWRRKESRQVDGLDSTGPQNSRAGFRLKNKGHSFASRGGVMTQKKFKHGTSSFPGATQTERTVLHHFLKTLTPCNANGMDHFWNFLMTRTVTEIQFFAEQGKWIYLFI